jgi:hypothetical protein
VNQAHHADHWEHGGTTDPWCCRGWKTRNHAHQRNLTLNRLHTEFPNGPQQPAA